jgi:hypothetical protein
MSCMALELFYAADIKQGWKEDKMCGLKEDE